MTKCPYTFPARSRVAMTAYLLDRRGYCDHYTGFPFSWNVKAYHVSYEHPAGEALDAALDMEWLAEMESNCERYNWAVEDAQRHYADKEWTSYPGDDQGDWQFGFYGRSGGHLCLEEWRGLKLYGRDFVAAEWLASLSFASLRAFYRGIVCADSDFTPRAACENIEAQLNWQRSQWEDEQHAEQIEKARDLEASRPDMYAD